MSKKPVVPQSAPDPIVYLATIMQRLLSEPFGLGLALFLAVLFGFPSQIPDMIDPYFTLEKLHVAFLYVLLSALMGYTVWFWLVAAIRTEALIPGGRYYTPMHTPEIQYIDKFQGWYRPFNVAAIFAGVVAFLACVSRPTYKFLEYLMNDNGPGFVAILVCMSWYAFVCTQVFDRKNFSLFHDYERSDRSMVVQSLILFLFVIYAWIGPNSPLAFTLLNLTLSGVLLVVALVDRADRDLDGNYFLRFQRSSITKPERRFSWIWSFRFSALFFAAPHGVTGRPSGLSGKTIGWFCWAIAYVFQIISPLLFIAWLFCAEVDILPDFLIAPRDVPTPIMALVAITMAVGPMVLFLSFLRDGFELLQVILPWLRGQKAQRILIARSRYRESIPKSERDAVYHDPDWNPQKVELLALSMQDDDGRVSEAKRVFARAAALVTIAVLFFADVADELRYDFKDYAIDRTNADYDPSVLTYHVAPSLSGNGQEALQPRPNLKQALVEWHKARGDVLPDFGDVPIVIVAAAGGANRASVWTLSILDTLNRELPGDDFRSHVFALSGVSGGSLGSVTYAFDAARRIQPQNEAPTWPLEDAASRDLLTPAIAYFFNVDLLRRFDPGLIPTVLKMDDRNEAIERSFRVAWENDWQFEIPDGTGLLDAHAASEGRMPHLLLNGVDSRSGQRILTSTLQPSVSLEADRPHRLFPETQDFFDTFGHDIRPSTAVMNSARFPLISPSGRYHAKPQECAASSCEALVRHQIIDGGYYENSGIQTAYELALAIDALAASPVWDQSWKPRPLIVAVSNSAAGVLPEMVSAAEARNKNDDSLVVPVNIDGINAWRSKDGTPLPYFDDVTPTCDQQQTIPDTLRADANEYAPELGAILRGVARTGAVHNHRSFRIAFEKYCGRVGRQQIFHFGLPAPVALDQSAPMNWVLSPAAVTFMVREAPQSVVNPTRPEFLALETWFDPRN